MSKQTKNKKVNGWAVIASDGEINWSLYRPEFFGVKARAKEYRVGLDKIVPAFLVYQLPRDKKR